LGEDQLSQQQRKEESLTLLILAGGRDVRQLLLNRNRKWIENLLKIDFAIFPPAIGILRWLCFPMKERSCKVFSF